MWHCVVNDIDVLGTTLVIRELYLVAQCAPTPYISSPEVYGFTVL